MPRTLKKAAAVALCLLPLGQVAKADEIMDRAVADAQPHMHHSCGSVLESYGEDEAKVADIVRLIAMISLYNRQIDVLGAVPDEEDLAGLKDEFVEELEDACDDDPGMLLVGAVDIAVRDTFRAFD